MQCSNCGAALKSTAKICISCGTPVSNESRSSSGGVAPTTSTVQTSTPSGSSSGSVGVEKDPAQSRPSVSIDRAATFSDGGGNLQSASVSEREKEVPSSPQYEAAPADIYIKDRTPISADRSKTASEPPKPPGKIGGKLVMVVVGFVVVVGIGAAVVILGKKEQVVPAQTASVPVVIKQSAVVVAPVIPEPTTPPAGAEAKSPDAVMGSLAIDSSIVTKEVLNQLLQLAIENDWSNIDSKVRSLKGISFDGGDRKVARALNKTALELMARNEFGLAVVELEKAVAADRNDIEIRNNLGYAELRAGRFDAAVSHLLDTLLIDPSRAGGWLNAAEAFAEKEKSVAAEASLKLAFHFSRDQTKALAYIKGDSSQIPSQRFRAAIQKAEPGLGTVPQFAR
jgi:hypothetical protein